MRRNRRLSSWLVSSLALGSLIALVACQPSDPAAQVAKARGDYQVKLNSFLVMEPEVPEVVEPELDPATDTGGMAVSGAVAAVAAETAEEAEEGGEEAIPEEVGPRTSTVLFDLVVRFEGSDPLPGVTVEISHVDAERNEKELRFHYLETGEIRRGGSQQIELVLEGFEIEEGDAFSVDLQSFVAPEDYGRYREFAEATGG